MASYIDHSLAQGEEVLARARFHWIYTIQAVVVLLVLGWVLIGIYLFFEMMIYKWTTEIAVTNHRFIKKTGLFRLDTEEITVANIEGVKVHQGLFGRVFGYGRLVIEGTGVDDIVTPNIANPVDFRRSIRARGQGAN